MQLLREEPKAKNSFNVVTATLGEIYLNADNERILLQRHNSPFLVA